MVGLVRIDARSQAEVERFLTSATGAPVRLGRVWLAPGRAGAALAAVARASAITFGSVICLGGRHGRAIVRGADRSHLDVLGALLVHELVHTWQYRRSGYFGFISFYLFSYFTNLNGLNPFRRSARQHAYQMIPFEVEAFDLEIEWQRTRDMRT